MASLFAEIAKDGDTSAGLVDLFSETAKKKFEKVASSVVDVPTRKRVKAVEEIAPKKQRKPKKPKVDKDSEITEEIEGTTEVFVGNLPLKAKKTDVQAIFKEFGSIKSVRFRSLPIAGTAVDEAGNINLVKKVCANSGNFSDAKNTQNAYVVFVNEDDAKKAVGANGLIYDDHHLRIDFANNSTFDAKKSVFLGNLPTKVTEEEVRAHFAAGLNEEPGSRLVEGVRIIRDSETQVGKGFGYLLLSDRSVAARALLLNASKLKGRELRVQVCGKRFKGNGQAKEGKGAATGPKEGNGEGAVTLDFQGKTPGGALRRVLGKHGKKNIGKGGKGKGGKGKGGKGKGGKGKGGKGKGN